MEKGSCIHKLFIFLMLISIVLFGRAGQRAISLPALPESPFVTVAERVKPTVANLQVERSVGVDFQPYPFDFFEDPFPEFYHRFFPPGPGGRSEGEPRIRSQSRGSGVIIDREGYIITNNHLVAEADRIRVRLSDGREFEAQVVGADPATDIALIKIKDKVVVPDYEVAVLGDSDQIRVGDWAIAIGNPYGLDRTVTVGVISAKGRSDLTIWGGTPQYQDFIQTDASINFGNSGGPLVNIKGEVIGINTAINTRGQGIGFAIPISLVKTVIEQLRTHGRVIRGWLGVEFEELTPELVEAMELPISKGVIVVNVIEGDPADQAGIKRSDVIVEFDGKRVEGGNQFRLMVASTRPGWKVPVKIIRNGKPMSLTVELKEREVMARLTPKTENKSLWPGITVDQMDPQLARQYGVPREKGVVVVRVEPGSPAEDKGVQEGDIILEVNGAEISSVDQYQKALTEVIEQKRIVLFLVRKPGGAMRFVTIKPKGS